MEQQEDREDNPQRMIKFFLPSVFCLSAERRMSDHKFVLLDEPADPDPEPEPEGCGISALCSMDADCDESE
jgi:hypothetical protein